MATGARNAFASARGEHLTHRPRIHNTHLYRGRGLVIGHNNTDYSVQTYGSVSPDGMKFLVGSNWGAPSGRPAQSYVVDISALCRR